MTRMTVDCRTMPSESNCSLTITGTAEEVARVAVQHSVDVHGHEDTPELRAQVEASMVAATEGVGHEGSFIQLVEFQATPEQMEQGQALVDKWQEEIGDARTARWAVLAKDRDQVNSYVQIVEFPSHQEAMANSDHPATRHLAEQLGKLATGGTTYRNLDVVQVDIEV